MFRTDTGNFNRFLTSCGLLLLGGALLVPYFYFHDTETLLISQDRLQGLTTVGRQAIEARQHRAADLEIWVLALAGCLAAGGLLCLWFGGRRLRLVQIKEDAAIDRQAERDEAEIQRLSDSEVREKREEQAREAVDEVNGEEQRLQPQAQPRQPAIDPGRVSLQESRAAVARIEGKLRAAFEESKFAGREFLYEVKTFRANSQIQLDGLFRAIDRDGVDVVLESKVVRQARSLMAIRVRQFADAMLGLLTRYHAINQRKAMGWLLLVIPEEIEEFEIEDRRRIEDRLDSLLTEAAKATIVSEKDIDNLPARFEELFGPQA